MQGIICVVISMLSEGGCVCGFAGWLSSHAKGRTDCCCKKCGYLNIVEFPKDGLVSVCGLGEQFVDILIRRLTADGAELQEAIKKWDDCVGIFDGLDNCAEDISVEAVLYNFAVACLGKKEVWRLLGKEAGKK